MSKQEIKTVKGLVKQLRSIRDKMNVELEQMSSQQRTEYFQKIRAKSHSPEQTI